MMTVAISTPIRIGRIAFFQSISRIVAISEPVQAPVPGSGIPTNSSRPRNSPCFMPSLFLCPLASIASASLCSGVFFIHCRIFFSSRRMNGTGRTLPITQIGTATPIGTPSSAATISPPLHSRIGNSDTIKMTSSAGITCPRLFANQVASALVILIAPHDCLLRYSFRNAVSASICSSVPMVIRR